MKIKFEKYSSHWPSKFQEIRSDLLNHIGFLNPIIEHIGSTSVPGLSAKPIIDILIGLENESDLDKTIHPLISNKYIFYEIFNAEMPYRRFFVKHKTDPATLSVPQIITEEVAVPSSTSEHNQRLAHIHILKFNSAHWNRHIAFRDYLRNFPKVAKEYQKLKEKLCALEWEDGNHYNLAKNKFIKLTEGNALDWYGLNTN